MVTKHVILGVHVVNRIDDALAVQRVLSRYAANIRTRLGLHRVDAPGEPGGLILLDLVGEDEAEFDQLAEELDAIEHVVVKRMDFEHPPAT